LSALTTDNASNFFDNMQGHFPCILGFLLTRKMSNYVLLKVIQFTQYTLFSPKERKLEGVSIGKLIITKLQGVGKATPKTKSASILVLLN